MVAVLWKQASAKFKQYLRNTSRWSADVMRPDPWEKQPEVSESLTRCFRMFSLFRCFPVLIRSWISPGRDSPWFPLGPLLKLHCRKAPNIEPVWLRIKRVWRASQGSEMTSRWLQSHPALLRFAAPVAWFALLFLQRSLGNRPRFKRILSTQESENVKRSNDTSC